MTIAKVAAGVLLGNLGTALISFIIIGFWAESQRSQAVVEKANTSYNAMLERQKAELK